MTGPDPSFPPATLPAFLELCAGQWMGLRSQFTTTPPAEPAPPEPAAPAPPADDDAWHSSERGDVDVRFEPSLSPGSFGMLVVSAPSGSCRRLDFLVDGRLHEDTGSAGSAGPEPPAAGLGHWQLWTDGSLELVGERDGRQWRERIWFTKPNLRLRSSVAHNADGSAAAATFCSEIRRVRAASPVATPA